MSDKNYTSSIVIEPNRVQQEYLKDLFRYRELFYFFAWRDIIVRYKQAFFGIAWALLRPFLNMIVFTFVFSRMAHLSSDNVNYSLFVLAGLLPWQLFACSLSETTLSLLNHSQLLTKIYFPRIIIPSSLVVVHFLDFSIGMGLLLILGLILGGLSFPSILFLPLFIGLAVMLCIGSALWLSALTVQFRDFRFIVPFVVQCGMFISPVGYGSFIVPETWRWLFMLNPMVGIIDGFRWSLFDSAYPGVWVSILLSTLLTSGIFISGFLYFRKTERSFADHI